jgi:hypothetical protein
MSNLAEEEMEAKAFYRHQDMLEAQRQARKYMHWSDPDNGDDAVTYCPRCGAEEYDELACDGIGCKFNAEGEPDE